MSARPSGAGRPLLLLYSPEMEGLAARMADARPGRIRLHNVRFASFPDQFPNNQVEDAAALRNASACFLVNLDSPASLFSNLSVLYTLPRLFCAQFTAIIPFFATGTAESQHMEGQIITGWTLARLLSDIPMPRGGPTSCVFMDMHSLHERFFFSDTVAPAFATSMPLLLSRLKALSGTADPSPATSALSVTAPRPDEAAGAHTRRGAAGAAAVPGLGTAAAEAGQQQGAGRGESAAALLAAEPPAAAAAAGADRGGEDPPVVIVFPDHGAQLRFGALVSTWGFPLLRCIKIRAEGLGGPCEVQLQGGSPSPAGKHAVIVDDICRTGATLLAARRLLFSLGAAQVSAFVPHANFTDSSLTCTRLLQLEPPDLPGRSARAEPTSAAAAAGAGRAFAQLEDGARTWDGAAAAGGDASRLEGIGFTHIWVCDTVPRGAAAAHAAGPPFTVLSVAEQLAEAVLSI